MAATLPMRPQRTLPAASRSRAQPVQRSIMEIFQVVLAPIVATILRAAAAVQASPARAASTQSRITARCLAALAAAAVIIGPAARAAAPAAQAFNWVTAVR